MFVIHKLCCSEDWQSKLYNNLSLNQCNYNLHSALNVLQPEYNKNNHFKVLKILVVTLNCK